jgi:plasmid segregation protein ParM
MRGSKERVNKAKDKALESLDYIIDYFEMPDFVDVTRRMGGDTITYRIYDDGRRYYKVGEGRAAITEDKISDENARLLTMIAIAKELSTEGVQKAEVILAVGLPFSDYGREKKQLIAYYNQKPELRYEFEGIRYDIKISQVFVFPQCYSAISSRLGNMKEDYLIVDIGSKTTDVVYLNKGLPVESRSVTIEKAMVKWMRQIQGGLQVRI